MYPSISEAQIERLNAEDIRLVIDRIEHKELNVQERTAAANLLRNYLDGLESRVELLEGMLDRDG